MADPSSEQLICCPEDDPELEPEPVKPAPVKPYVLPIPFSQRLRKQNTDKQFSQFTNMLKKLRINIAFADALAQMPKYEKFM